MTTTPREKPDDVARILALDATETGEWEIFIAGYGFTSGPFIGTEKDAEEARKHKARWEGGAGWKCRIGKWARPSDILMKEVMHKFANNEGVSQEILVKIRKLKEKESIV